MPEPNSQVSKNKGDFDRFDIPVALIERLRSKGIESLFPVQYKTFNFVRSGYDLIVLARTGTGKTLAFALPIVSMLLSESMNKNRKQPVHPSVLILAPTRELVAQISTEFQALCETKLSTLAVYGGVPIGPQCASLRRGVNIVIGTPGRIIDLLERNALNLEHITQIVLDEVDRMLDMGFSHDVESIISRLYPENKSGSAGEDENSVSSPQTLLFSATMPSWVSDVAQKYLSPNTRRISLIDKQDNRTATGVSHLALPCPYQERASTMADVIRTYCKHKQSRCIVFCERKKDADELAAHAAMSSDCHVFHGDIPQDKRELVLQKFREGKYRTLITTNVAARGLDIPEVDLVIQCHPPRDVDDYIHRSGRTGRAERCGTSIVFHSPRERPQLDLIEKKAGISFRRIAAPTLNDILDSWGSDLLGTLESIPKQTWSVFVPIAQSLIEQLDCTVGQVPKNSDDSDSSHKAVKAKKRKSESEVPSGKLRALCCALARLSGKDGTVESRSLLNAHKGFTTYKLEVSTPAFRKGQAYALLRQQLPENILEDIKNMSFMKGHKGFVFDLPSTAVDTVNSTWSNDGGCEGVLEVLTNLPELEMEVHQSDQYNSNHVHNGGGRGRGRFNSSWTNRGNRFGANRGRNHGGDGEDGSTFSRQNGNKLSFNSRGFGRGSKRDFSSNSSHSVVNGGLPKKMKFD